jgi:hypothetical protein
LGPRALILFSSAVVDRKTSVRKSHCSCALVIGALVALLATSALAQQPEQKPASPSLAHEISSLEVPRLPAAPKLTDFEAMEPATDLARKMLQVGRFIQRDPKDGVPVSQHT